MVKVMYRIAANNVFTGKATILFYGISNIDDAKEIAKGFVARRNKLGVTRVRIQVKKS